ncbi:scarecrow-like protein 3 [Punica granatum]|uniref:Scarecrow-like protein 3 n=1 Tax=Punica granatum TaxID=22663 RepID=A0A218VWY6_PUNGR|nr:scarecrow-like protein 3 [Punica granatum]OWM64501.1 hypothetical protein CDL15_Pgr020468 [Punica granatum]
MNSSISPSSSPSTSKPDVTLSLKTSPSHAQESFRPEERGVRLIQLLLSCAKHVSSGNLHRADAYLRQISELALVSGDSMQRLSAWMASGLAVRLVKCWPGLYKALNFTKLHKPAELPLAQSIYTPHFPYLGFACSVVARTLVRSLWREEVVHVVDLGSGNVRLWSPLLKGLAQLAGGPPHLKVTCVCSRKSVLETLGHGLVKEAETLEVPFQFNPVNAHLRDLTMEMLNPRSGEIMIIVSVLGLHALLAQDDRVDAQFVAGKSSTSVKECKQMGEFLAMVRSLSPKIFFLVEQEANQNTNRLVDRFVECLHYYSAMFDSIDASYGASLLCNQLERLALEEMLGREIENILSCEGLEREERHERHVSWTVRFSRAGFKPVRLWLDPSNDEKGMFETRVPDGYKVVTERACTMISWHERPLYAVSAWSC